MKITKPDDQDLMILLRINSFDDKTSGGSDFAALVFLPHDDCRKKPKGEREKVHSKTLLQLDSVLPFFACGLLPRPIHDVWVTTLFQALMEQHIVLSKNHSDHHHQTAWSAKCGLGPASLWSAAASCVSAEYPLP